MNTPSVADRRVICNICVSALLQPYGGSTVNVRVRTSRIQIFKIVICDEQSLHRTRHANQSFSVVGAGTNVIIEYDYVRKCAVPKEVMDVSLSVYIQFMVALDQQTGSCALSPYSEALFSQVREI